MKISIEGTEYPLQESIGGAALGDLLALKKRGITVSSIQGAFKVVAEVLGSKGTGADLLENEEYIDNIIGVIFLALRKGGQNITLADAEKVPASEVFLVLEESDLDPKDEEAEPPQTSTT
ncbi:hypothetical protein ACFRFH_12140 [Leifsonia sp. NPDC056824]|uniref:hypothetical protein n=1 Tax=Leifsonia sp. NPDC056824 TaxID=3345953 RepID=UPI003694632E